MDYFTLSCNDEHFGRSFRGRANILGEDRVLGVGHRKSFEVAPSRTSEHAPIKIGYTLFHH